MHGRKRKLKYLSVLIFFMVAFTKLSLRNLLFCKARIFNIYLDLVERWQENWAFHLFSSDFLFKRSWSSGSRTFCFLGSPVKWTFNSLHFIINLGRTSYDKISDSMHCSNSTWLSVLANCNSGKKKKCEKQ